MEQKDYIKIYHNAVSLIDSAAKVAEGRHYGVAIALLILGLEELIKYQVVLNSSAGGEGFSADEFNKVFRNHKTKHSILKEFATSLSQSSTQDFHDSVFNQIQQEEVSLVTSGRFAAMGSFLSCAYANINLSADELKEFIKWLDEADNMKKAGFYVDYSNNKWSFPSDMQEPDYLKSFKFVESVKNQTTVIKDLDMTNDEFINFLNE